MRNTNIYGAGASYGGWLNRPGRRAYYATHRPYVQPIQYVPAPLSEADVERIAQRVIALLAERERRQADA